MTKETITRIRLSSDEYSILDVALHTLVELKNELSDINTILADDDDKDILQKLYETLDDMTDEF